MRISFFAPMAGALRKVTRLTLAWALLYVHAAPDAAASNPRFNIPAGAAESALKQFSAQSGRQVIAPTQLVQGVKTQPVKGELRDQAALDQMFAHTGLVARLDEASGAFAIVRADREAAPNPKTEAARVEPKLGARATETSRPATAAETVELSPFVVREGSDVGYLGGNTLAGSRLDTPLRDTAASINILTAEFLSDIGALSVQDAFNWMTNSSDEMSLQQANDNNYFSGNADGSRTRGISATRTRNYFVWNQPADIYNIERIEDARGPNSILFGIGSAGGVINVSTKRPNLGRNFLRAAAAFDNNGTQRGSVDANHVLLRGRLGLRFNAVYSDRDDGQKLFAFQRNKSATLAAAFALNDRTTLRAEYEGGRVNRVIARPGTASDGITTWLDRGKPLVAGTLTAAQITAAGVSSLGATNRVTYVVDNGRSDGTGTLFNTRNLYQSAGTGIDFVDENIVSDAVNAGGPGQVATARFNSLNVTLERQFGKKTFLELAFNHQDQHQVNYKSYQQGSTASIRADPNRTLADGTANPYAGRLFTEGVWAKFVPGRRDDDTRLSVTTEFDFGKWGNYRLAGMASHHWYVDSGGVLIEVWEGRPFGNNAEQAGNFVWRRSYLTEGDWSTYWVNSPAVHPVAQMKDPVTGTTLTSGWASASANWRDDPSYQDTVLLGLQARYFSNRLVLGTGLRRDWLQVHDIQAPRNPANGAFELDYNGKIAAPIDTNYKGLTKTLGAVYHLTKAVSLYYNVSSNFALPNTSLILIPDARPASNTENEGTDYGVAVELLDGRVYARANYYETHSRGAVAMFGGTANSVKLLNDRIIGGLLGARAITQTDFNQRQMPPMAAGTYDAEYFGCEFSLTGNLTKHWRLSASYSYTDGQYAEYGPEVAAWWAVNKPYYVKFDPNIPSTAGVPIGKEISDWETLYYNPHLLIPKAKGFRGNRRDKIALYTNYRFSTGPLRGLSLGGGYRFQGKQNIGNYTDQTIQYGSSFWVSNATIGYRLARVPDFLRMKSVGFQLNVDNATNNTKPIVRNRIISAPGFYGSPERIYGVTTPAPRSWRFTTNIEF